MTRTFHRAYPEYVTGVFTETEGKDITAATVQVALSASRTTPPAVWVNADATNRPTPASIRASMLIDQDQPAGDYWLWLKVVDNPETLVRVAATEKVTVI